MKNIKINKMKENNISELVDIWYEASLEAHSFIPKNYWQSNKELMKSKYLPMSETYVAIDSEIIVGFISLIDEYLAAIFVKPQIQGLGVGSLLLNYAKSFRKNLQLKVFCKNKKSVEFYKSKDFEIVSELKDEETGENEFIMHWQK